MIGKSQSYMCSFRCTTKIMTEWHCFARSQVNYRLPVSQYVHLIIACDPLLRTLTSWNLPVIYLNSLGSTLLRYSVEKFSNFPIFIKNAKKYCYVVRFSMYLIRCFVPVHWKFAGKGIIWTSNDVNYESYPGGNEYLITAGLPSFNCLLSCCLNLHYTFTNPFNLFGVDVLFLLTSLNSQKNILPLLVTFNVALIFTISCHSRKQFD